ncbi:MAG: TIGR03564 family F420-dependent LLM class oxidoreductase [Pseudonocardiaceae bacterium]
MRLGIMLPAMGDDIGSVNIGNISNIIDATVEQARQAEDLDVRSVWFPQRFDYDSIALAAVVGREVPGVTVGSAAVPIIGRHPLLVGALAQTAQAATGGRFQLGIGLGAKDLLAPVFGRVEDRPITHLREFLTALRALLDHGEVDFGGETLTARTPWPSPVPGAEPSVPVLVAAMGPQALRVAGELADGTLPLLAGPTTLAEHLVPTINKAADRAGRPQPRIVALVAGVVTGAVDEVRAKAYQQMQFYESIPSYRRVLDLEGADRAGDLAVIGSEEQVAEQVRRYVGAGATELVFTHTDVGGAEDQLRTWRLLGQLVVG